MATPRVDDAFSHQARRAAREDRVRPVTALLLGLVLVLAVALVVLVGEAATTPVVYGQPAEPGQASRLCRVARLICPDSGDPAADLPVALPRGLREGDGIVTAMRATGRGRTTLQWLHDNGIRVELRGDATGGYYDPGANRIVLGPGYQSAVVVIHERNHAEYDLGNRHRWARFPTRAEYIRGAVREEVDGVVSEIIATVEFERAGVDGGRTSYSVYAAQFWRAYAAGKARAQASGNPADEAVAAGRAAGRTRITELFMSGQVTSSVTGRPYVETFGQQWEDWRQSAGR